MSEFAAIDDIPQDLRASISQTAIESGLCAILSSLLSACRHIGTSMRDGEYSHEEVGTTNSSGDDQLHVDLATEAVIFDKLKGSGPTFLIVGFDYFRSCRCLHNGFLRGNSGRN